jgi:hypothetical protein
MAFLDELIRTIRAPLDAIRNKIWGVRSIEGRVQGDVSRLKSLPAEFRGEIRNNVEAVRGYGRRAQELKGRAGQRLQGNAGAPQGSAAAAGQVTTSGGASSQLPRKAKMGLFSKKKKCPSCGEKLHVSWDLCPYCGYGAPAGGGGQRTQALSAGPSGGTGGKGRTMALDASSSGGGAGGVGWLVPLDGPETGELFQLKGRCVIGTSSDCDVVVSDPSVSGRHAEFSGGTGGYRISDLGSTNGTFVNDKRVTSSDLVDGDSLRLGRTSFKFKSIT